MVSDCLSYRLLPVRPGRARVRSRALWALVASSQPRRRRPESIPPEGNRRASGAERGGDRRVAPGGRGHRIRCADPVRARDGDAPGGVARGDVGVDGPRDGLIRGAPDARAARRWFPDAPAEDAQCASHHRPLGGDGRDAAPAPCRAECDTSPARGAWDDWGLVFPSATGEPWNRHNFYSGFRRVLARSDVNAPETTNWHSLRHTAASLWLRAGVDVFTVSRRLGHGSASFTMDTYGHLLRGQQQAAAEALDHLLG